MRKEVEKEESKLTKVGLLEVTDMSLILSLKLNKKAEIFGLLFH